MGDWVRDGRIVTRAVPMHHSCTADLAEQPPSQGLSLLLLQHEKQTPDFTVPTVLSGH